MYKTLLCMMACAIVAGCCNCRYNDYLPENNVLSIPEELRPVDNAGNK